MKIFIIPTEWHDGQDNIQQVQCVRARYQDGSGMIACRRKRRPKGQSSKNFAHDSDMTHHGLQNKRKKCNSFN
jgi:hypothetical protein